MPDSPQSRSSEPSLRASLLRHVGGGVLLVAGVSVVFWAIGTLERSEDGELAGQRVEEPVDERTDDEEPVTQPPDDADESDPPQPEPSEPDDNGDAGEPDTDDDGGDDAADDEAAEEEPTEEEPADEEPAEEPTTIEPSTISVQVLDGYQSDGGAAANGVATELRDAGYNVIAENPALRYDVTTVLWTAGHEAEARQVAAAIGAPEAREQSGNLSTQVAVHVVVGSDRG